MESSAALKEVRTRLRERKLRVTAARERLATALIDAARPLSADELHEAVAGAMDRTTVYRTLESFERAGIVRQVDLQQGSAQRYELAGDHHHHITCLKCGRIRAFSVCGMEPVIRRVLADVPDFAVDHHSLEIFGYCRSCA